MKATKMQHYLEGWGSVLEPITQLSIFLSPELLQVPQHPNSDYGPEHGPVTEILYYIGLRKIDNWVTGSNSCGRSGHASCRTAGRTAMSTYTRTSAHMKVDINYIL